MTMNAITALSTYLPSIPYPHPSVASQGYWLPVTSTINWCEEDYYATIYAAEIVNTITNSLFVILAILGYRSCLRNDHDRIFLITFAGYAAVGTGSILFHGTLKYPMQLVDELSMIYTTCFSCYASYSYRRSTLVGALIGIFLGSLAVFITAYYHYIGDPEFHQRCFAILIAALLIRSMVVQELILRPSLKNRKKKHETLQKQEKVSKAEEAEQKRVDERDSKILTKLWMMIGYGLGVFLLGFAIWSMDNRFCGTLRVWRRQLGLPWGILLEGHGWWHIMTGMGSYFMINWSVYLRHCLNGKQDQYELYWPSLVFSIPMIIKKDGPDAYLLREKPTRRKLI